MTSIHTRRAGVDDLSSIVPLFDQYRFFYGQPSDPSGAERFLHDRITRQESIILLGMLDDHPAGFLQCYPSFSSVSMRRSWILNDLFVSPEHRHRGIARALMTHAEHVARSEARGEPNGAKDMELKTASDNLAAQTLYESLGWHRETAFLTYVLRFDGCG